MKRKELLDRPISWIIFGLLAIGGVFYIYHNFDKANSLINVDIQMDRETAIEKAAELSREYNIGPQTYKKAAAFRNDSRFQNFVELEAGGIDTFTQVISHGLYESYHWSVRHFLEQDANEVVFWFKPNGDTYGFWEKIPEAKEGASLDQEEALRIAEHHAIYNWDVDLSFFELVEKSKKEQTNGRIDHTFVYERHDKSIGNGKFRLKLVVSGDKLTRVEHFVKIPEDFDRRYSEMRSANDTIATIASAAIVLIYGVLGVILAIFILMRSRRLIWKPPIFWGLGIAFASVFLVNINSLPFTWFSYDTSLSQSNFLTRQILNGLLSSIGFGALLALTFMAAEGLGRMAFPKHIQWWKIWSKSSGGSLAILKQTGLGYLFAIIILALDVFFYVTTTTHFGWWSPAGTLSDPNILATYLPWLDSIAISLQAGFWEEALFRAVPIAGIYIITNGKKSQNFWIILVLFIQTLIFGAGHANYPQQPSYARVIEMIVPFAIMGVIYIYYGILPAIIAHYAVDVFWFSLPLWVSSTSGVWIDRILVLLFLFVPVFIILFIRLKNKRWTKIPDEERNSGWLIPAKLEKEEEFEELIESKEKPELKKWLIPLGILGLITWILFTPFKSDSPKLNLSKHDAISIAKNTLLNKYNLTFEEWTILSSVEDQVDIRDIFVWRVGGKEAYQKIMDEFLASPHWKIRLVKTKGKAEEKTEEYIVRVTNDKRISGIYHKLPEKAPGKNLEQNEVETIADSVLTNEYSLDRNNLKEISVSPKKQENRTDWELIYADTTNFKLSEGQGRYVINIAGDEVVNSNPYVHIPEDWERKYKQKQSKKTILKTTANIVIIGILILGLVLGIIRWTRKKFHLKVFIIISVLIAIFFILDQWINWASVMAGYTTQVPMGNFITMLFIGIAISGIFMSLFQGILVAATPGWLKVNENQKKHSVTNSIAFGIFIASIFALIQSIVPKTKPFWSEFSYLNSNIPMAGIAFSEMMNVLFFPAFASILFLGIHHFTKSWTNKKWIGITIAVLTGMALMAMQLETYTSLLISGLLLAIFILSIYVYFIRFHFEWIPLGFGIIPILRMIKKMVVDGSTSIILGGLLMIVLSVLILYWWYKILLTHSAQKR